ncbi:hypothetical protein VCSRO93_2635 [Vibrio cholerae]|nr:hypothetical protein VCSRO93_2635 [Vibrio cholerae]
MFIIIWKLWLAKCLGNLNTQRLTTKISSLIWPAWLCANYDIYIRHDIDFLSALPEAKLVILKDHALIAVQAAESMIVNDRRRNRDSDVPVIFTHARFDDDAELEWFETPIVNQVQHHK